MKRTINLLLLASVFIMPAFTFSQDVVLDFNTIGGFEFEDINMGPTNILQNKTAFTIEFRFNNLNPGHAATYFAQQNGDDNGVILMERWFGDNYIRVGGAGIAKWGFDPVGGDWYHYAIVFDGTGNTNEDRLKIYLNGELQTVDAWTGTIPQTTPGMGQNLYIGCKHYGMGIIGQDIDGQYEEFRIWDKALSQPEISGIINYEATGEEENLIGFFSFNEGIPNENNQSITAIPFNDEIMGQLEYFLLEGDNANFVGADASIPITDVEENINKLVNVYPNPNQGVFSVDLFSAGKINIMDARGKIVKYFEKDAGQFQIDLTGNPSGIYFMNITTDEIMFTEKIIVK